MASAPPVVKLLHVPLKPPIKIVKGLAGWNSCSKVIQVQVLIGASLIRKFISLFYLRKILGCSFHFTIAYNTLHFTFIFFYRKKGFNFRPRFVRFLVQNNLFNFTFVNSCWQLDFNICFFTSQKLHSQVINFS